MKLHIKLVLVNKNYGEVLSELKCRYDFSTLYNTLPHYLIKEKLLDLIEWTFKKH